jgi:hypothetical protein
MSLSEIRAAIQASLAAVPNIGTIHAYERFAARPDDLKKLYMVGDRVRGGFITRTATRELEASTSHNNVIHRWRINYYVGWSEQENSAAGFDYLVECMRAAFRDDETIGDVVSTTIVDGQAGLQLEDAGPVMFAGTLCHGARFSLQTKVDEVPGVTVIDDFATGAVRLDAIAPEGSPLTDDVFQLETQE